MANPNEVLPPQQNENAALNPPAVDPPAQDQQRVNSDVSMMDLSGANMPQIRNLTFSGSHAPSGPLPWIEAARNVVNEEALRTAAAAAAAASADDEDYHRSDPAARLQLDSGRLPLFFASDKDTLTADLWIERVERTASLHVWSEKLTLDTAVNALRDSAAVWYHGAKLVNKFNNWTTFRFNFLACLGKQHVAQADCCTYLLNMLKPKAKGETLLVFYGRVLSNIQLFLDMMGSDLPPTSAGELHTDPAIRALTRLPNAPVIPVTSWQKCWFAQRELTHQAIRMHLAKSVFFAGLPLNIKTAMKNRSADQWNTVDQCLRLAMDIELSNTEANPDQPVSAVTFKRQRTGPSQKQRTMANGQPMVCHYCKKKGHGQRECRKRIAENGAIKPPPPKTQTTQQAVANSVSTTVVSKYPTYNSLN